MAPIVWDAVGERKYETGVDHGVVYPLNPETNEYDTGFPWNGLTTVTEKPSGAESNKQYADNIPYLDLYSREEFGGTIEALAYPPEFEVLDGSAVPVDGITVGQQRRGRFGLSYRTRVGNDVDGDDHAFKLHLVWGATASPSEKAFATVNDSPSPIGFSWDFQTLPVLFDPDGDFADYRPTSLLTLNSETLDEDAMAALMTLVYGAEGEDPRLPFPDEVLSLFTAVSLTELDGDDITAPTYDGGTNTITIPVVVGVQYLIDGNVVAGDVVITEDTLVTARPTAGYVFVEPYVNEWFINFT